MIKISEVEPQDWDETEIRRVTLLNQPEKLPYAAAHIQLESVVPRFLSPAAFYVCRGLLEQQLELRRALLSWGLDTLDLHGPVRYRVGDEIWRIMPPVVEFSREFVQYNPTGVNSSAGPIVEVRVPLIADGLHRVYLAKTLGLPITVVTITGASAPYYAYPSSWDRVHLVDKVPGDKKLRKHHRVEDPYSLYRDFGPMGIGKPRHPDEIGGGT